MHPSAGHAGMKDHQMGGPDPTQDRPRQIGEISLCRLQAGRRNHHPLVRATGDGQGRCLPPGAVGQPHSDTDLQHGAQLETQPEYRDPDQIASIATDQPDFAQVQPAGSPGPVGQKLASPGRCAIVGPP